MAINEAWELSRFNKPNQRDIFGQIRNRRLQITGGCPSYHSPIVNYEIFGSLCIEGQAAGKINIEVVLYPAIPSQGQLENDASQILNQLSNKFSGTKWLTWTGWGLLELSNERKKRDLEPSGKNPSSIKLKIMQNVSAICANCGREFVIPELVMSFGIPGIMPRFGCPECLEIQSDNRLRRRARRID